MNQPKSHNPICPYDLIDCNPNMDGYTDCNTCPRYCNGVRATGGMPNPERAYNWVNKLFKHLQSHKTLKNVKTS